MDRSKVVVLGTAAGMFLAAVSQLSVQAATSTASASVTANIATRASATLTRDTNSVTRFSASQIVFDRFDDQDPGVTDGNAGFMYAPYRSETGKNWHLVQIIANGSSMTLTASTSTPALASVLRCWTGGFFTSGATQPIAGTATVDDGNPKTDDWEPVQGFSRTLNQAFTGTVPFNYRLTVAGLSAGTHTGSVTFTLTSN
jgi:hypothetical protein